MKVATRLRGAFAIYIALLAVVVFYHVRTNRRMVASSRVITDIAARQRAASTNQTARATEMATDVEKYLVTRDRDYLVEAIQSEKAFSHELARFDSLPLSPPERRALNALTATATRAAARLQSLGGIPEDDFARARVAGNALTGDLDSLRDESERLGAAAQDAMGRELTASEAAARDATRVSWGAALGALGLSLLLSALIARSIIDPLDRLAKGTDEVSAGRFDYRLDADGDDELAHMARAFNSMTERLDELDRMKRDFAAKVSHDLKTPLSSMQETIRAVLDGVAGELTPKQRQLLEMNRESGERLSSMVHKLLDLSRIEAGLAPERELLDLVALAHSSANRFRGASAERRIEIDVHDAHVHGARRVMVRGDKAALAQVIDNLLENALKFSPALATVTVDVTGEGLLRVSDEGPGVPDDEKEKIFGRFYQAEAGRAVHKRGVGLGLTICREIVTAHGGRIWVTDNEPRGSVFNVLLPGVVAAPDPVVTAGAAT